MNFKKKRLYIIFVAFCRFFVFFYFPRSTIPQKMIFLLFPVVIVREICLFCDPDTLRVLYHSTVTEQSRLSYAHIVLLAC